jgi:hypothetical protein
VSLDGALIDIDIDIGAGSYDSTHAAALIWETSTSVVSATMWLEAAVSCGDSTTSAHHVC